MGVSFSQFWSQLGVPSLCEGDSSFLERFFCGKASKESLDGSPSMQFLDNLAGKKHIGFRGCEYFSQ